MMASRSIISKATGFQSVAFGSVRRKMSSSAKAKFDEVEIKVPWGKVAGKLWNPNGTSQPILALHGWQDNAGSFDKLVPLLPENTSVLAIDFPGHGLSSWIPDGMVYTRFTYLQVIHRIRQHFGWEKMALMGHSLGSIFCFTYSVLYPDDIKFVIAFDFFKPPERPGRVVSVQIADAVTDIAKFLELEKSKIPPSGFTEEQTVAKLVESTKNSLDEEAAKTLMIRGTTKKSDGKVYVNRDPRVKIGNLTGTFGDERLQEQAEVIKSPYMILKGANWHYNEKKNTYFEAIEVMKKGSADIRYFKMPGSHHFHMTNPEPVAEVIIPFIEKYN